jgi:hypothetical protein
MPNEPRADAVVLRFSPMSAEGVLTRAERDSRRSGGPGLHTASVWADHPSSADETRQDVIKRLLQATEMQGLDPGRNPSFWWCSTAKELLDRGFSFIKDGEPDEADQHYSVVLGNPPDLADAARFVEAFVKEKR